MIPESIKKNLSTYLLPLLLLVLITASYILYPLIFERSTGKEDINYISGLDKIEREIISDVKTKQDFLVNKCAEIKNEIKRAGGELNISAKAVNILNNLRDINLVAGIYLNKNLIAWTQQSNLPPDTIKMNQYSYGETHFCTDDLYTNFCIVDSLLIKDGIIQVYVAVAFEKYYKLREDFDNNISYIKVLNYRYKTDFDLHYFSETAVKTAPGQYSFPLFNNFKNKICVVNFVKPHTMAEQEEIRNYYECFIASLWMLFLISAGIILVRKNRIQNKKIKISLILIYLIVFRYVLHFFEIPARFIDGPLTGTAFFSSIFGFGIVNSPLELFTTILAALIFCYFGLSFAREYFYQKTRVEIIRHQIIFVPFLIFVYLLSLRGMGASLHSVIFDSTFLYFKNPDLLPELPAALMHLNVLLLGFCALVFSITLIILIFSILKKYFTAGFFVTMFFLFQLLALLYDVTQQAPQGTPFTRVIFILLSFVIAYSLLLKKMSRRTLFLALAFSASFISVNLLNYYNFELEKESLKISARTYTNPEKEYLDFLIEETFSTAGQYLNNSNLFSEDAVNYDSYSYILWSNSILQQEAISSSIEIYNADLLLLGGYNFKFDDNIDPKIDTAGISQFPVQIKIDKRVNGSNNIIRGTLPIIYSNQTVGYLVISINHGFDKMIFREAPEFLTDSKNYRGSAVDLQSLKIFDFHEDRLINVYGDINPGLQVQEKILSAEFNKDRKDTWLELQIGSSEYFTYILQYSDPDTNKLLAIALLEKDLTRSLFDFFKVFFIHTFFIGIFFTGWLVLSIKSGSGFKYSFKGQLLIGFLVISIIPLLLLAAYFRNLTEEKNNAAIFYKLKKRVLSVENYINIKLDEGTNSFYQICDNASNDIGVDFSLYDEDQLIYSSKPEYHNIGLLPVRLNSLVYEQLVVNGLNEFVSSEYIDKYEYNSFYYYGKIGDRFLIVQVNDIFNSYLLPMSENEVDIFLFGSYSLAVLLIIIISTILANQISRPIQKLTKATRAVAGGDLNFELYPNARGEVKELVDGFNRMIKDLHKTQAELAEMERETAWKEMARQVAHEIKNPLTPMKLAIQHLVIAYNDKSPQFNEIFLKVTKTFEQQIDTLRNIANEFSNFARMPKPQMHEINLPIIVQEAVNLFIDELAEISVNVEDNDICILGDTDQLKRTLINMVRNSIQAKANKIEIHISKADKINLRITDNGRGIPEKIVHQIFDANFTTKVEGMGLGLNMAKRYLEKIGGEIKVENTSAAGTSFILTFPGI